MKQLFQSPKQSMPSFLAQFQRLALQKLETLGAPHKKMERFRKFPFRFFSEKIEAQAIESTQKHIGALDVKEASQLGSYQMLLSNYFHAAIKNEVDPFALLNTVNSPGRYVILPAGEKQEMNEIFIEPNVEEETLGVQKWVILANKNAQGAFFLNFNQLKSTNPLQVQIEVLVEDEASVEVYADCSSLSVPLILTVRSHVKENAHFSWQSFANKVTCLRNDCRAFLKKSGAHATIRHLGCLEGRDENFFDWHVEHEAPETTSNQDCRMILTEKSRSNFSGMIYVHSEAQKTQAYQLNNNLLCDESVQCFSKPNLEIYADDVKASHGSTLGKVQNKELFYLQSRGIAKKKAQQMIARSFAKQHLAEIPNLTLQKRFDDYVNHFISD